MILLTFFNRILFANLFPNNFINALLWILIAQIFHLIIFNQNNYNFALQHCTLLLEKINLAKKTTECGKTIYYLLYIQHMINNQ